MHRKKKGEVDNLALTSNTVMCHTREVSDLNHQIFPRAYFVGLDDLRVTM